MLEKFPIPIKSTIKLDLSLKSIRILIFLQLNNRISCKIFFTFSELTNDRIIDNQRLINFDGSTPSVQPRIETLHRRKQISNIPTFVSKTRRDESCFNSGTWWTYQPSRRGGRKNLGAISSIESSEFGRQLKSEPRPTSARIYFMSPRGYSWPPRGNCNFLGRITFRTGPGPLPPPLARFSPVLIV